MQKANIDKDQEVKELQLNILDMQGRLKSIEGLLVQEKSEKEKIQSTLMQIVEKLKINSSL